MVSNRSSSSNSISSSSTGRETCNGTNSDWSQIEPKEDDEMCQSEWIEETIGQPFPNLLFIM